MKKVLIFLLIAVLVVAGIFYWKEKGLQSEGTPLASEEAVQENSETIDEITTQAYHYMIINSEPFNVSIKDGFDNCGFSTLICDGTDVYEFKSVPNGNDVTWSVYIFDEPFEDADRFILQSCTPALVGNGKLEIEDGKYVYIHCSINGFTGDATLPENESYLEITRS